MVYQRVACVCAIAFDINQRFKRESDTEVFMQRLPFNGSNHSEGELAKGLLHVAIAGEAVSGAETFDDDIATVRIAAEGGLADCS